MDIRLLKPSEIEVRVQSTKKTTKSIGCVLLLYKDARSDMKILDETFGNMGWQRSHELINGNLFCNVEVWDEIKNQWIKKQDVGTESMTEKEKGQASDSFKRACFNLGIGRELYTSPFIWVSLQDGETNEYNGKLSLNPYVKFSIKSIGYNTEKEITSLEIQDNKGVVRFTLKDTSNKSPQTPQSKKIASNTNTLLATKEQINECLALAKTNSIGDINLKMLMSEKLNLETFKNISLADIKKLEIAIKEVK